MRLSQLLEEKRKAKKRQAMAKTAKTVGLTAIVGASVGAVGGILFAPKSGKETREDIKNSSIEANEKLKVKASEAKDKLNKKIKEGKENLSEANLKIKDYLKNKRNKSEEVENLEEISTTSEEKVEEKVEA